MRARGRRATSRVRIALALGIALLATGCWDRIEVNDIAIVQGVALDKAGENALELTVAIVVPSRVVPPGSAGGGSGPQHSPLTTKAATGRTVMDAITALQKKSPRRLFWAHNAILLVGEELARENVVPAIEFFTRQREPRLRTVVGVVPGKASEVMATVSPIELNTPTALRETALFRAGVYVEMRDFVGMLTSETEEAVASRIETVTSGATEPGGDGLPPAQENPPQAAITGTALFQGARLVGFLDERETRGLLWLRDELQTATVTAALGEPGKWVSFELLRAKTELKPHLRGGRIVMEVKIRTEDDLNENAAGVDTSDPKVIELLERELAATVAERVLQIAEKVQKEFRSDVFGFGEAVRRTNPRMWESIKDDWDNIFPEVEIEVNVEAFIRRTGLSANPLPVKDQGLITFEQLKKCSKGRSSPWPC